MFSFIFIKFMPVLYEWIYKKVISHIKNIYVVSKTKSL